MMHLLHRCLYPPLFLDFSFSLFWLLSISFLLNLLEKGLASAARMMLVFADVPFKDTMYAVTGPDDKGNYDMSAWTDVKFKLDLDFPNLPYIMDMKTGFKITMSKSIYRYIARQFKIGVQDDPYLGVADMMLEMIGQVMQVESPLTRSAPYITLSYGSALGLFSDDEFEAKKKEYIDNMPTLLKDVENYMLNKKFVTGAEISYADFALYYLCVAHVKLDDTFLERFGNLAKFYKRFGALEGMKKWHKTEWSKLPLNNVMAKFK